MNKNKVVSSYRLAIASPVIKQAFIVATFSLLLLCVVVPNSVQTITAATMLLCFFLSISFTKLNHHLVKLFYLYLGSVIVTLLYLIVGIHNGAPLIAVEQISIIYILSPLMWIYISAGLIQTVGIEKLIRWFVLFCFLSCLSVALFFYLFIYFGPNAVSFFQEKPNLDLSNGNVAATMFVYGSLIFICGGFFSTPDIVDNKASKILILITLAIVAMTSGRSALILSIPTGIILGRLIPVRALTNAIKPHQKNRNMNKSIWLAITGTALILFFLPDINVLHILESFSNKLISGGGTVRSEQVSALLDAIINTNGVGSGHGIGVSYVRDDEYPWRYESVWMATIFRVGLLGAVIYLLPFLWYLIKAISLAKSNELLPSQRFLFSGFICSFLAANTNPYIESFVFQWMYVLPVVSLLAMQTNTSE